MLGAMIFEKAMPLLQAVSPDLQQAIQQEVQEELRQGRFRFGPRGGGEGLEILIPIAFFAMIVLIVFVVARRRQAELRARAEFQKQILDKFGSGKEFAEFMASEGSQRFLASLSAQTMAPRYRVMRGMRGGIVLAALGLGFLLLAGLRHGFIVPGVLCLALGAGFLISAAASYHFSKKWSGGGPAAPGQPLSQS
jgi:hypothetical protein